MEEANESAWSDLINFWAREYKRLFCSPEGDVSLPPQEKVPEEEMRTYVDNYKKWFSEKINRNAQNEKLEKLQKVAGKLKMDLQTLNEIIEYMKKNLTMMLLCAMAIVTIAGCASLEERLASADYETRKDAETELYSNAINSGSESEVLSAVNRMTCDDLLAAVAASTNPEKITRAAVEKMKEEKWLSSVAVYGKSMEIQKIAIGKMQDQDLLLEVYRSLSDEQLRFKAVERMRPETIAKLPYSSAMAIRWKDISSQQLLERIVARDLTKVPESEWGALIAKITDEALHDKVQESLAYVYASNYDSLSDGAKSILVANISDKDILEEMITEPDERELEREERDRISKQKRIKRSIEQEESRVAYWKGQSGSESHKRNLRDAQQKLAQHQEELRKLKEDAPRHIYVQDESGRAPLYEKLGDGFLVKMANEKMKGLRNFHEGDSAKWDECNAVVGKIKSQELRVGFYAQFLTKIGKDEEESDGKTVSCAFFGSYTHYRWTSADAAKAQMFVDAWGLDKSPTIVEGLLLKNVAGYRYLIKYASADMLLKLMKTGALKTPGLQISAIRKIDPNSLDMALYNSIKNDDVRKVMMARMPESVKKDAEKANAAVIDELLLKAKNSGAFNLKGFYVGMPIADAKRLVSYYLPGSRVVITKDNNIEIDVVHGGESDVTPMYFCRAGKDGLVNLLNFDRKRFLNKWFSYDVQNYEEWAAAFGRDNGCDFREKIIKGGKDLGSVWIKVSQEAYQYKNNMKGCVLTYFGEKTVVDPNGEGNVMTELLESNSNEEAYRRGRRLGMAEGLRIWVKNGWENEAGAREGTLRLERLKDE